MWTLVTRDNVTKYVLVLFLVLSSSYAHVWKVSIRVTVKREREPYNRRYKAHDPRPENHWGPVIWKDVNRTPNLSSIKTLLLRPQLLLSRSRTSISTGSSFRPPFQTPPLFKPSSGRLQSLTLKHQRSFGRHLFP